MHVSTRLRAGSVATVLVAALVTSPLSATITIEPAQQFQTIEGFGGFGPMKVWWSGLNETYYTDQWLDLIVNDLGVTMIRDVPPSTIEEPNDNADPNTLNLAGFNLDNLPYGDSKMSMHIPFLRAIKQKADAAGEPLHLLASWWSPPAWMKQSGETRNGGYIKDDAYEEFAEMVAGYCKIVKEQCGYEPYAVSPQDEPAFVEPYESCQWTAAGLAKVSKLIGQRLAKEGLSAKVVIPEELSSQFASLRQYVGVACSDTAVNRYVDILAFHSYDTDGVGANVLDSTTMKNFAGLMTRFNKVGWQTETSGYGTDWLLHAKNMLVGLKYARLSSWVYWYLADDFIASDGSNRRTKFYYSAKNFYRYVRPGAVMVGVTSSAATLPAVAFGHRDKRTLTVVVVNDQASAVSSSVAGTGVPQSMRAYRTSATENCVDIGSVNVSGQVTFPARSVTTFVASNWDMPQAVGVRSADAVRAHPPVAGATRTATYMLDGRRCVSVAGAISARIVASGVRTRVVAGTR